MDFFRKMSTPAMLSKIAKEVKETTVERVVKRGGIGNKTTKRGRSETLIDEIHKAVNNRHLAGCVSAEWGCLMAYVEEVLERKNAKEIIDTMNEIIRALYFKPNVLATKLSEFSKLMQERFPDSEIATHAKKVLHMNMDAAITRKKDYSAKIYKQLANQKQIVDSDVLQVINDLRYQKDLWSLTVCVALACGSRLIEIIRVSTYKKADNPYYVRVEGVAKDRADPEDGKGDNKRIIVKPIVGGIVSDELIAMVEAIRKEIEERYHPDERELSRKELTNLVNAQVNKKVREVMGEGYVFHDLRSIYAQLAWPAFGQAGQSQTYFFSQVLGHQEGSLIGYQKYFMRQKLKEDDPNLVAKINNIEAELQSIKKYKDGLINTIHHATKIQTESQKRTHFINPKGEIVEIEKQVRRRDKNKEARLKRLQESAEKLAENGIDITARNLLKLGYGSRIVNEWNKSEQARLLKEKARTSAK